MSCRLKLFRALVASLLIFLWNALSSSRSLFRFSGEGIIAYYFIERNATQATTTSSAASSSSFGGGDYLEAIGIGEKKTQSTTSRTPRSGGGQATTHSSPSRQQHHAYAFLIAGCGPETPEYRNYLYGVLVAAWILREDGAKDDIVLLIQMNHESTATRLPAEETRWLQTMNVTLYYVPKAKHTGNFYTASLDRFRILGLTQYSRILFMDADVLPMGDLGYIFEASEKGIIKENLLLPAGKSPANAGFFMVAPYPNALREMNEIIQRKERRGSDDSSSNTSTGLLWDPVVGWGHKIVPPDRWWTAKGLKGTNWSFIGSYADQGLLYHWTKYHRMQVSIMRGSKVENWGKRSSSSKEGSTNNNTTVVVALEAIIKNPFLNVRPTKYRYREDEADGTTTMSSFLVDNCDWFGGCYPPMNDQRHFLIHKKPWIRGLPAGEGGDDVTSEETKTKSPYHLWFYTLSKLNRRLGMGLNESSSSVLLAQQQPKGRRNREQRQQRGGGEKTTTTGLARPKRGGFLELARGAKTNLLDGPLVPA